MFRISTQFFAPVEMARFRFLASAFSIVECLSAGGTNDADAQRMFKAMLTSGQGGVIPFQTDIFVMEAARDLRWQHGIALKPIDLIHVATAIEAKCAEMWTWDGAGGQ